MDVYGITNCSTVKKARDWLSKHEIDYTFHDFKKEPPVESQLKTWLEAVSWETLVNRKGMTWRKLSDIEKAVINSNASAIRLMIDKPSIIKRPIVVKDGQVLHVGFDVHAYQETFGE